MHCIDILWHNILEENNYHGKILLKQYCQWTLTVDSKAFFIIVETECEWKCKLTELNINTCIKYIMAQFVSLRCWNI